MVIIYNFNCCIFLFIFFRLKRIFSIGVLKVIEIFVVEVVDNI